MTRDVDELEEFERELQRVVDRLTTMPLAKLTPAREDVMACAEVLVAEAVRLGVPVPPDTVLPDLQTHGLGSMIAVLGQEVRDVADSAQLETARGALTTLRRALP